MNPPRTIFADAFYWVALVNRKDSSYQEAVSWARALEGCTIVTTDEVLTEVLTYFAERGPFLREKAVHVVHSLLNDPDVRVVPQTRESFLKGLDLYKARLDKGYSLTDCISMNTMRAEQITDVLTNDVHFTQEGFRALFRA